MKQILLIPLLFSQLNLTAQKQSVFDTSFANNSSKNFFVNNPVIDSIVVSNTGYSVYLKTNWKASHLFKYESRSSDYYRTTFLGDMYLFEKKYGKLILPEKEVSSLVTRGCSNWCRSHYVLSNDSIRYHLECTCPSNQPSDDYDRVFTKIEIFARIKGGTGQLKEEIQLTFNNLKERIKVSPLDSVLIYKVWVYPKDSCLHQIELSEGSFSPFEQMVMEVLKQTCLWLPAEQGGRPVTYISQVFVKLKDDNSIVVDVMK